MLESDVYKKSQDRFCNNAIYSSGRTKLSKFLYMQIYTFFFENYASDNRKCGSNQMEQKKDMKKGVDMSISTPCMIAEGI